jgi:hypothetical protein
VLTFERPTAQKENCMESWYKATLSQDEVARSKNSSLLSAFTKIFLSNRCPKDAAMLSNPDPPYFPAIFYFSPGAVTIAKDLIKSYSGVECDAPSRKGLTLLVGTSDLSGIPFSE